MVTVKGFRHIAVVVRDLENMIRFYTQILGFEVKRHFNIKSEDFRKGVAVAEAEAKGAHLDRKGDRLLYERRFGKVACPLFQSGWSHLKIRGMK